MTKEDIQAAIDDFEKLSKCPSIWQEDITKGSRKLLDNHHETIKYALQLALDLEPVIQARRLATGGEWYNEAAMGFGGILRREDNKLIFALAAPREDDPYHKDAQNNNADFICAAANALRGK